MNGLTQKGIQAFKSGDKTAAQNFFRQALQENPADENAWLWLAGTFEDNKTRILCLEKVLAINPENPAAQKGLAQLKATAPYPPAPAPAVPPPPPPEPETPQPAAAASPAAMLAADDLWTDDPENTSGLFFDDRADTDDIFGDMPVDDSPLIENVRSDAQFSEPKPIVQEGIILPDGSSARVSHDDSAPINFGPSTPAGPIRTLEAKPLPRGRYAIRIPGFEDHQITLKPASFSRAKLLFDGEVIKKEKGSKTIPLTSVEGLIAKIEIRPSMLDPLPQVWVDGEKLNFAPPIKWYQWAWISVPLIVLIVLGTFVGVIFGIPAMLLNIQIFRSRLSPALQYAFSFLVTFAAVVLYTVTAYYLTPLLMEFISSF
jgi:hypothetical protein